MNASKPGTWRPCAATALRARVQLRIISFGFSIEGQLTLPFFVSFHQ
jgi:hypothetical protein